MDYNPIFIKNFFKISDKFQLNQNLPVAFGLITFKIKRDFIWLTKDISCFNCLVHMFSHKLLVSRFMPVLIFSLESN